MTCPVASKAELPGVGESGDNGVVLGVLLALAPGRRATPPLANGPEEPPDTSPLPLLPSLEEDGNLERIHLPLGRPIASIHRHLQLASSEPREVYHYQVSKAGLQRGQKKKMMLLGSLSHDAGQPALLLSFSSATAGFQEAHLRRTGRCRLNAAPRSAPTNGRLIVDSVWTPYRMALWTTIWRFSCACFATWVDSRAALIHAVRARERAR